MADFWFVEARSGGSWTWVEPRDLKLLKGQEPWPELEVDVARGDFSQLAEPPAFSVDQRGKLGDLLWTTGGPCKIASDRFIRCLESLDATGWDSRPAAVTYKNGDSLEGYNLLAVTGQCDEVLDNYDPTTAFDRRGQRIATGIDVTEGWDGTDLFYSRGRADRDFIVTDRVAESLKAARLTGLEYTRADLREVFLEYSADEEVQRTAAR